ncbi:hypothetical protein F4604DRAFT_1938408 [Suillus subluteus]|nr:hypothetical protein F4604DRAFT_1938408 [Suillus subluteus]
MSSSQHTNDTLNLVVKKIDWLVKRSEKLKASDPAAKTLAHEIAVTLATAFTQHGNAATSLAPLLLSCMAEIRDKSGANGKLKALPNWGTISDNDPWIRTHPLFPKSVGKAVEPASKKARTCLKKCEASKAPQAKSRARSTKVKSKEFITDDECDEVPADKVIFVKSKTTAMPGTQTAIPEVAKSKGTQCKRCIKDNIPCTVVLGKKKGKIWKCCRNCDEKKMKCIRLTPEEASIFQAVVAEKKAKAANKKSRTPAPRTQSRVPVNTRATSRVRLPSVSRTLSPLVDKSTDEDAEGEDVAEPADNDINMDFDTQTAAPDLPVSDSIQAMCQEFAGMLQNSGDHSEAINRTINTRVNDLAHNWEERFAAMKKKMQEVELHMARNMVSIVHMANAMKAFTPLGDVSAFQPPPGPSTQGHPFGQIPQLPPLADDGHLHDPSASEVQKLFTTAWDESRGPGAGVAEESSASAVESSGSRTGLSAGSQLSSLPSGRSSPKDWLAVDSCILLLSLLKHYHVN